MTSGNRRIVTCYLAALLVCAASCKRPAKEIQVRIAEPYLTDDGSVGFDIEPVTTESGATQWLANYTSQGKTARFRIQFGSAKPVAGDVPRGISLETGEGQFLAETGSDSSVLLADLKKALQAKSLPKKVRRVATLDFTFVSLGHGFSQAPGGGFNTTPPGN